MKKLSFIGFLAVSLVVSFMLPKSLSAYEDYGGYSGAFHGTSPDAWVLETGGSLTVKSGASLIVNSGATVSISSSSTSNDLSLTYGISAATGVFTAGVEAADFTSSDDVIVGDDLNVTGLATIGETLSVTGNSYLGSANHKSTNTASTGAWVLPAAVSIGGALTGTSGAFSTTMDIAGNVYQGAALYRSTFTASSGAQAYTGAVTGPSFTGSTSVGVPATGMIYAGTRTIAQLMADTAVAGEIGICSNCTPVEIFISTGAGAPNTGGYGNAVGLQLD